MTRVYEYPSRAVSLPTPTASSTVPSTPAPTPPFLDGGAPAGATVLIPETYGTGPMTLPSFTVASNVTLYVEEGCLSTSASDSMLTITETGSAEGGGGDSAIGRCYGGTGGNGGSAGRSRRTRDLCRRSRTFRQVGSARLRGEPPESFAAVRRWSGVRGMPIGDSLHCRGLY